MPQLDWGCDMGSANFDARALWQRLEKPLFQTLNKNIRVDTCVIGAGVTGLSVAYQLLRAGQTVAVLERERLGLGETGLSTGLLSYALDDCFEQIEKWHGHRGAKLALDSHRWAIDEIERLIRAENLDAEFERVHGYLFSDQSADEDLLKREFEKAQALGINGVSMANSIPVDFFYSGRTLVFPDQAQLNPIKYLTGLAEVVQRRGGSLFTHTEAVEIRGGYPALVKTRSGYQIECEAIVEATNVPINNRIAIHLKNAAYRSYVVAIPILTGFVRPAFFWDCEKPYHYLRFAKHPQTGESLLLVGGEDHRTGHDFKPENHFNALKSWIENRLGLDARSVARWSGQVMETVDGLAYIGRNPMDHENVFIATGDSGHGLTHGTIAGFLLRDLILGQTNPWSSLYDPRRLPLRRLGDFFREALQSTLPLSDWISDGDGRSLQEISPGEGAIVRQGLKHLAVYKDELHHLHCFSATCPHLGGLVRWNSAEKTWDCPCHGSRFDRFGQVLNGPAIDALAPADEPKTPGTKELYLPRPGEI